MNKININPSGRNVFELSPEELKGMLGDIYGTDWLPFAGDDATCGVENEFQTAVSGRSEDVDLPLFIRESNYMKNLVRRVRRGDLSGKNLEYLDEYLNDNRSGIWENSWVRFPRNSLTPFAESVLQHDLRADKSNPSSPERKDSKNFIIKTDGKEHLRLPVSYLLKLALADSIGGGSYLHPLIRKTGEKFMNCYLNDNTSPEVVSFFPASGNGGDVSERITEQTLKSYLLTQMLVLYANKKFDLVRNGQEVSLYFSPHPPVRQKKLNELITDSFYRELFMSPCLSGWDRGEEKHSYMILCHQVLSRSSINSVLKLKEAGIIQGERIYLKGISNISLANNGTHVSIGSRKLTDMLKNGHQGFGHIHEKYFGDLAIKIFEHFLPLFTGTYTSSPYRLDYRDFHPEKVLGFLSHEMDFTHLRMLWRRWQKKARLGIMGNPVLPFGPAWLEKSMASVCMLRGDIVSDFRMIDFLVALLSTEESPLFDGMPGNDDRLRQDLASMGIFDTKMSVYTLYRMRSVMNSGFSGFEGRFYSLFESIEYDMKHAISLQILITALAYRYILNGDITHSHIPDTPEIESERRQIVFGTSIGIPTFYVKRNTGNFFMAKIISGTKSTRNSNRYQGYLRIYNDEYRRSLVNMIKHDAADLIESMNLGETVSDLERRIDNPAEHSASARITAGILDVAGTGNPFRLNGDEFNSCAEKYYRETLRRKHIEEAFRVLVKDITGIEKDYDLMNDELKNAIGNLLNIRNGTGFIEDHRDRVLDGSISILSTVFLIHLLLITLHMDMKRHSDLMNE